MLLSLPLSGLLAWWLFSGPGEAMFWRFKGWCPGGCLQPAEFCVCRPDLDQQVECDDGTEFFIEFEPDADWEFTAWEDLTDEERDEIG